MLGRVRMGSVSIGLRNKLPDTEEVHSVPYQSGGSARVPETQPVGQVAGEAVSESGYVELVQALERLKQVLDQLEDQIK